MSDILLQVEHLTKQFPAAGGQTLTAVKDVSLTVRRGETVAIVGESGCGKSTLVKTVLSMHKPTEGKVIFDGKDTTNLHGAAQRDYYRHIQMVFQDPAAAFDPKMRVKEILTEALLNYGIIRRRDVQKRAEELLDIVELPKDFAARYPHNMSGGQRQRVAIARALALEPDIIICDEATSALDVSVQDSIIRLLVRLQKERGMTYLFICHDLALVSLFAHRVAVMYLGSVMEKIDGDQLSKAQHPYTQALLRSVFPVSADKTEVKTIAGDLPSPLEMPKGCPFATRCEKRREVCQKEMPLLKEVESNHFVACHLVS